MKNYIFSIILITLSSTLNSQTITESSKKNILKSVADLMEKKYINSSLAKKVKELDVPKTFSRKKFIKKVNKALYKLTKDKHLFLEYNPVLVKEMQLDLPRDGQKNEEKNKNYGFNKLEILENNIGYLKLDFFPNHQDGGYLLKNTFSFLKNTDGLIIDLRENLGGNVKMLENLVSYFIPSKTTLLNVTYSSGRINKIKTTNKSPNNFYKKDVIILISENTFSAGEAFTFIMKNFNRSKVIGGTSAGAGNIAGPYIIDKNYILTITIGEILDPIKKTGWEKTGVQSDIIIKPKKALEKAKKILKES